MFIVSFCVEGPLKVSHLANFLGSHKNRGGKESWTRARATGIADISHFSIVLSTITTVFTIVSRPESPVING